MGYIETCVAKIFGVAADGGARVVCLIAAADEAGGVGATGLPEASSGTGGVECCEASGLEAHFGGRWVKRLLWMEVSWTRQGWNMNQLAECSKS